MDKVRMRRSRSPEVPEEAVPEALVTEDHADAVVTSLQVRLALARLSPGHREVLEEIYLNGCTAREAATRLGIPEGTVFSRSYYALRILLTTRCGSCAGNWLIPGKAGRRLSPRSHDHNGHRDPARGPLSAAFRRLPALAEQAAV
jgi:hypothetical protein